MQRRMPAYMDRSAQSNQARSVCGSETTEYKASRHRPEAGMTRRPSRQDNTLGRCCRHTRPLSCPCSVAPSVCSCLVPSRPDLFSGALRYGSLVHGTTTSTRNFRGYFLQVATERRVNHNSTILILQLNCTFLNLNPVPGSSRLLRAD